MVEMNNYSVLLDFVNRSNYNVLKLQNSAGDTLYVANTTQEKPLVKGEDDPSVPPPFNAYSGVGQAQVGDCSFCKIGFYLYLILDLGSIGLCKLWTK